MAKRRETSVCDDEDMMAPISSDILGDILTFLTTLKDHSADTAAILHAIRGFCCLLSFSKDIPVVQVLDSGALPFFITLLQSQDDDIVFEAAWAITNIASTSHTSAVACAAPSLIPLLVSNNKKVREQAA